ncbi:ABC transporter, ATP-binding protein, partial [gut metagenome]
NFSVYPMLTLRLSHFGVAYSGIPAIVDLSLELTSATFAVVSGVLGAGKTSLLRAIEGRIRHTGKLSITDGDTVINESAIARPIKRHLLNAETSVYQFVLLGLLQKTWSRPADADERIQKALERCCLLHKSQQPISSLSPSEMRLAELAQLFVQNPKIILIDEPEVHPNPVNSDYLSCISKWVKETKRLLCSPWKRNRISVSLTGLFR